MKLFGGSIAGIAPAGDQLTGLADHQSGSRQYDGDDQHFTIHSKLRSHLFFFVATLNRHLLGSVHLATFKLGEQCRC